MSNAVTALATAFQKLAVAATTAECWDDMVEPRAEYDKANAGCIYCVGCQTKNPVEADRCSKCNLPLLK